MTVKTQQIYYILLLQSYMFRLLRASAHERFFLPQWWNSCSGRVFLGCAHGRWKKRNVLTFCSLSVSVCGMDFVESVAVCARLLRTRTKRRKWFWVHPLVSQRLLKGQFHKLYEDLRIHPQKFFGYCRMTCSSFDELSSERRLSVSGHIIRMSPRQ